MTRQQWTNAKERAWLESRKARFQEAQQQRTTSAFYSEVYKEWEEEFKIPQPAPGEISAAGSLEAAIRNKRKALEKRLFQWFHNNMRPTTLTAKEGVIPVQKQTKIAAAWQIYQKRYYETKLRAIVDTEYIAHLKGLKPDEKPKTRIQLQTEICRREYEKESDEVKAEIEQARNELIEKNKGTQTEESRVEKYQQGVDRVQKTLVAYMRSLEEATGWTFCVLGGGPNPRQEGKINRILYESVPEVDSELTFEETLSAKEWKTVLLKWNEHLNRIFPENIRKQRACSKSKSATPSPEQEDPKGHQDGVSQEHFVDNRKMTDKDDQVQDKTNMAKDLPTSSAPGKKSLYEIEKERNVARNRKLLEELFGPNAKSFLGSSKGKKNNSRKVAVCEQLPKDSVATPKTACDALQAPMATAVETAAVSGSTGSVAEGQCAVSKGLSPQDAGSVSPEVPMEVDQQSPTALDNEVSINESPNKSVSANDINTPQDDAPSVLSSTMDERSVDEGQLTQIPIPLHPTTAEKVTESPNGGTLPVEPPLNSSAPALISDSPRPSQAEDSGIADARLVVSQSTDDPSVVRESSGALNAQASADVNTPSPEPAQPGELEPSASASTSSAQAQPGALHRGVSPPILNSDATPAEATHDSTTRLGERESSASASTTPAQPQPEAPHQAISPAVLNLEATPAEVTRHSTPSSMSTNDAATMSVEHPLPPSPQTKVQVDWTSFSAVGYVNDEKDFEVLRSMSANERWSTLLDNWAVFERCYRHNGSLPTKPRPSEIAWWMKNNRKLKRFPPIVKAADFIISWRQWWMAMQPDWHTQDSSWPPSRVAPEGCHWPKFAHSGPNGMFLLMLSLGWWGKLVANGSGDKAEYETALDDVLWVLSRLLGDIPTTPTKRGRGEDEEREEGDLVVKPCSKRSRKSI